MNNEDMQRIAREQSALECGCAPEDFLRSENMVVPSRADKRARVYLKLPQQLDLCSYGHNIVASCSEPFREIAARYINRFTFYHCFETPNLFVLSQMVRPLGSEVCFMAEYWLPDLNVLRSKDCAYTLRFVPKEEFAGLYLPEWSNALCKHRPEFDRIAVGAYDGDRLIGLAGASADCERMWQIGIDVLPDYRMQGVASALTSRLALAILEGGHVPFYCCAWSNVASARNAIASGFRPAWVQVTVKPQSVVDEMNEGSD